MIAVLFLVLCSSWVRLTEASPPDRYLVKPTCIDFKCGDFVIPYPFGIGKECYANSWFSIDCKNSSKPFLNHTHLNLEVLNVSLMYQTVTVNSPLVSFCKASEEKNGTGSGIDLSQSPFRYSLADNIFMVLGCGSARLESRNKNVTAGCASICENDDGGGGDCYGINCCQTTITPGNSYYLDNYHVNFRTQSGEGGCVARALMVGKDWFSRNYSSRQVVIDSGFAPLLLIWKIEGKRGYCSGYPYYYSYDSDRYYRADCSCQWSYEGNPHLQNGCQVVKECANCNWRCDSRYNFTTRAYSFYCNTRNRERALTLGFSISGGSLFLILFCFGSFKVVRKQREIRLKRQFFKRNGGLLLEQQVSADKVAVEKTKIFTSKELEKATDNFNTNRILGKGGQGTVYKGMLSDGRIVAVKRSTIIDENQLEHFINEIVILSQINHRNVVKILGCCLETEVPLLVYEFISNGNLFELIHDHNSEFPFSWEMRLQIAIEVSGALSYLHSACSIPIYHRDIKSTNILLDDKYRAKVSDFGTSRSIAIEQTHLTTLVQGTFGYLDPEYFQSSQFTDKSDVYSFGVVLVELLTGEKPISSTRSQEEKSLATYFILSLQQFRLFDIVDTRIVKEGRKEDIIAVANLASRCLDLNGRKRPTMKEVTMELEQIRVSPQTPLPLNAEQNFRESACVITEIAGPLDGTSTSTETSLNYSKKSSLDEQPLLSNTF